MSLAILRSLRWIYKTFYKRNDRDISHAFDMDVVGLSVFLNSLQHYDFIGALVELQNIFANFVLKHQSFHQSVSTSLRTCLLSIWELWVWVFLNSLLYFTATRSLGPLLVPKGIFEPSRWCGVGFRNVLLGFLSSVCRRYLSHRADGLVWNGDRTYIKASVLPSLFIYRFYVIIRIFYILFVKYIAAFLFIIISL